ncbi:MAG TPA: glycoside hydrolase family 3 C-terminal domain-containing protein [Acidobacteriaceae bacterium]|nr:glycoside hydrolase family 3 C-terminal domain-containing protein [Acidobacteriaceae bacterium]
MRCSSRAGFPFLLRSLIASAVAGICVAPLAIGYAQQTQPAYKNTDLPIAQRVDDLVGRMTLAEKVSQMQNQAPAIPRLGIPAYNWWSEGLHGVARAGYATVFPQAIGMAATWDTGLMHQAADVISTEARAKFSAAQAEGNHDIFFGLTFWSPNINIFRDPRWGRGQETYGEDPYLTSRMGVAFVTGLQGDDPKYLKVVSTPKHYDVHSGPESERHSFDVNVSPHDLEDTYLPAFRATVTEAHADSVMCAYNAIDGAPACANQTLLKEILRHAWHFNGYVVSDCGAISDIADGHKFAANNEQASVAAVRAGTDLSCGDEYATLVDAVHDGMIPESEIDTSVKRLMTARFRLGMFDPQSEVRWARIPTSDNDTPEHRRMALQAAREAMVLLKNANHTLPFESSVHSIAVIGPNAAYLPSLEGNYNGQPSDPITPYAGMRDLFTHAGKRVVYAQGSPFTAEVPLPVPPNAYSMDAQGKKPGLKVEYFTGSDFSATPVATGTADYIDTDWNAAAPVPALDTSRNFFSVRYTGSIRVPAPGDYTFRVGHSDCYPCGDVEVDRVFIDGKLVSDQALPPRAYGRSDKAMFHFHFGDTRPHSFRLEYTHASPRFAAGISFDWQPPVEVLRQQAVDVAKQADVVVAFVGLSRNLEGEEMPIHIPGFAGGDRTAIELPLVQQDLLQAVEETGKPLVVVLMNGSALAVDWSNKHAAAILEAWYPGEAGGTAIAETLAGENNPAGRLPVTFYASLDQLPPFEDYSMANRTYRYFHGTPLYEFGYGLSYASFAYSNLKLSTSDVQAGDTLTVEGDVRNTSKTAGDEVAELYFVPPQSATAPLRSLEGFQRVHLAAGETKHITFTLHPRQLSQVTADGTRMIVPGSYSLYLGSGQPGVNSNDVQAQFQITGSQRLPR